MFCLGLQTKIVQLHQLIQDSDSSLNGRYKKISEELAEQGSSTEDRLTQHKLPLDPKQSPSQSESMLNLLIV